MSDLDSTDSRHHSMNAEQLLTHFDRIANAPDAIPRLRRFILDLAVRGKLVEQNPNDEPASELLKRIAAEKAAACKGGGDSEAPPNALLLIVSSSSVRSPSRITGSGHGS